MSGIRDRMKEILIAVEESDIKSLVFDLQDYVNETGDIVVAQDVSVLSYLITQFEALCDNMIDAYEWGEEDLDGEFICDICGEQLPESDKIVDEDCLWVCKTCVNKRDMEGKYD